LRAWKRNRTAARAPIVGDTVDNIMCKNFYTERIYFPISHFKLPLVLLSGCVNELYVITGARPVYTAARRQARARDVVILVTAHAYIINTCNIRAYDATRLFMELRP
jgi:hypothetical protein